MRYTYSILVICASLALFISAEKSTATITATEYIDDDSNTNTTPAAARKSTITITATAYEEDSDSNTDGGSTVTAVVTASEHATSTLGANAATKTNASGQGASNGSYGPPAGSGMAGQGTNVNSDTSDDLVKKCGKPPAQYDFTKGDWAGHDEQWWQENASNGSAHGSRGLKGLLDFVRRGRKEGGRGKDKQCCGKGGGGGGHGQTSKRVFRNGKDQDHGQAHAKGSIGGNRPAPEKRSLDSRSPSSNPPIRRDATEHGPRWSDLRANIQKQKRSLDSELPFGGLTYGGS